MIDEGFPAPADGFFLSIAGARAELKTRAAVELGYKLDINNANKLAADAQAERDAAIKEAHRNDWCVKWCLEVGIVSGLILGAVTGGIIGKSLH